MGSMNIHNYQVEYLNRKETLNIKREIFNEGIYGMKLTTKKPLIIDAGAHIGLATIFFKSQYPSSKVISLEPNPLLFSILQKNIEQNNLENVQILNTALASKTEKQDFYIDGSGDNWHSTGSFLAGGWEGGYNRRMITVKGITLSSLLEGKKVDLLKLDIEGAEQRVLKEAASDLGQVENIVLEFHPTKSQNLKKIKSILQKSGFKISAEAGISLRIVKATRDRL